MRTLVRTLTAIVVLIIFTTAAGLRANVSRHVQSSEPSIVADVDTVTGKDRGLGITQRVGIWRKPPAWDELDVALNQYADGYLEGGFAPTVDYDLETFEAVYNATDDIYDGRLSEIARGGANSVGPLFAGFDDASPEAEILGVAREPIQQTNAGFNERPNVRNTRRFTSPSVFSFGSPRIVQTTGTPTVFRTVLAPTPVPLPAAFPMLMGALCLFGFIRRTA